MSLEPIRILVADDHPMIRSGLATMIQSDPGLVWLGEAANGREAVTLAEELRADVVLMDLVMPQMDGIDACEQLLRRRPQCRVLILTSMVDPLQVQRAIRAGASGFISKLASAQELITTIRGVASGRRMLSPDVTDALIRAEQTPPPGGDLTLRERDVLRAMTAGLGNQAIATQLGISVPTVKFHITHILSKLQVENRTEAVLLALRHRLVELPVDKAPAARGA